MPSFHTGTVTEITEERSGLQRVLVDLPDRPSSPAYVLTQLTGPVAVGDPVVVNTTAVDLGLGSGGWHVVHWNLARASWDQPGPGHIMKLRYTSLQADTGSAEEYAGDVPVDLAGLPVAVCGLHSQMAVVAAVFHHRCPHRRLVYLMTDGAALPLALSDLVHRLREGGELAATVTTGNAFGGDAEAVTVASGLAVARYHLGADAVVVAMGPGITGTGTALGTTGLEVAPIADAVTALGGRSLVALRVSQADPRDRHHGVSHHSRTALELCSRPTAVAVPDGAPWARDVPGPHEAVVVDTPDAGAILAEQGLSVTSMGRGPDDDPSFFASAAAAGVLLARWADVPGRPLPSPRPA